MALEKVGTILQYDDMNEVYQDLINTYIFMYCFCFCLKVFSAVHLLVLFVCFVGFYSAIGLKVDFLVTFTWSPSCCHHAFSKWGTTCWVINEVGSCLVPWKILLELVWKPSCFINEGSWSGTSKMHNFVLPN